MNKTHRRRTRHIKHRRHIGGYTLKNITGNTNSRGLGVKTFKFHAKHNKKRWNQKQ